MHPIWMASLGLGFATLSLAPVDAEQAAGRISGVVTTAVAASAPARVTIDQNVCGNAVMDETIVRNTAGQVANAVVTLTGVRGTSNPPAAGVSNDKCRFSPHVQVVAPQATITSASADPMLHTTHAQNAAGRTIFNVALPVPGMQITKPVGGPGIVRLSCNTHPWMRGWIVVTDEMSAITDATGRFTLKDVPPGRYELRIWHEALSAAPRTVTVHGRAKPWATRTSS